jgi:hypothetical protein
LVQAATVSSFLPRDLGIDRDPDRTSQPDAQRDVLAFSEEVHGPDGPKWALTQEARRSVLSTASKMDIKEALAQTTSLFKDPVSVALRDQLSDAKVDVATSALAKLEATRIAAIWLEGLRDKPAVDLDALDREIALRRVLKPFLRMVAAEGGEDARVDPSKIRFYGREREITMLRDYVGVLPAASLLGRLVTRLGQAFRGARPLVIWGIGGVGKTTLIAKFALEHAEAARSRYPFAYLDFDRATLSARRPELLLAEMCEQVGAQFSRTDPGDARAAGQGARALGRVGRSVGKVCPGPHAGRRAHRLFARKLARRRELCRPAPAAEGVSQDR